MDMLNGGLAGKLILFSIPLAFSSILQQLFNSADVAVVGRFAGDLSLIHIFPMERSVKQKGTACLRCAMCEAEGSHRKADSFLSEKISNF